jgi:methylated-DNA-protein-cysteine methyltransferase-like protein
MIESGSEGTETLIVQRSLFQTLWRTLDIAMTDTSQQRAAAILKAVRGIKRGTFLSYGEVARRAGLPGRARLVGTVLRESGDSPKLPWHRVTGAGGRIAFPAGSRSAREQIRRLEREGVKARGHRVLQRPSVTSPRTLDALLWKL